MLRYFENIYTGVWGRITVGGEACVNGEIYVTEIQKVHMKTNADGYYFRVLKPVILRWFCCFYFTDFLRREITKSF